MGKGQGNKTGRSASVNEVIVAEKQQMQLKWHRPRVDGHWRGGFNLAWPPCVVFPHQRARFAEALSVEAEYRSISLIVFDWQLFNWPLSHLPIDSRQTGQLDKGAGGAGSSSPSCHRHLMDPL